MKLSWLLLLREKFKLSKKIFNFFPPGSWPVSCFIKHFPKPLEPSWPFVLLPNLLMVNLKKIMVLLQICTVPISNFTTNFCKFECCKFVICKIVNRPYLVILSHIESSWVIMSYRESSWVIMSYYKSSWVIMSHHESSSAIVSLQESIGTNLSIGVIRSYHKSSLVTLTHIESYKYWVILSHI